MVKHMNILGVLVFFCALREALLIISVSSVVGKRILIIQKNQEHWEKDFVLYKSVKIIVFPLSLAGNISCYFNPLHSSFKGLKNATDIP